MPLNNNQNVTISGKPWGQAIPRKDYDMLFCNRDAYSEKRIQKYGIL